jgi:hypothetical protein
MTYAPLVPAPPAGGRRPWWQPDAAPDTPRISSRRAYVEVLAVFCAFFGASVANALLALAGRLDGPGDAASWAAYGPGAFDVICGAGLSVAFVVLLGHRRGVSTGTLGLRLRRDDRDRVMFWPQVRVAAWALLSLLISAVVVSLLKTGSIPAIAPSAASLIYGSARAIEAGFMEECVVLAFVVVTLQQARRPLWEIIAVALVLRVSYHLYYGPGALGILIWASVFLWLFLRTRSLLPLIAVHCYWDLYVTFARHSGLVAGLSFLGIIVLLIAAPISWLVQRASVGEASVAPAVPLPSWYPDPSGQHAWRWWDGVMWTPVVRDADTPAGHRNEIGSLSSPREHEHRSRALPTVSERNL